MCSSVSFATAPGDPWPWAWVGCDWSRLSDLCFQAAGSLSNAEATGRCSLVHTACQPSLQFTPAQQRGRDSKSPAYHGHARQPPQRPQTPRNRGKLPSDTLPHRVFPKHRVGKKKNIDFFLKKQSTRWLIYAVTVWNRVGCLEMKVFLNRHNLFSRWWVKWKPERPVSWNTTLPHTTPSHPHSWGLCCLIKRSLQVWLNYRSCDEETNLAYPEGP